MKNSPSFNNAAGGNNVRPDPHLRHRLFVAAKRGELNTLTEILDAHDGADNGAMHWRLGGKTLLQAAVEKKQIPAINLLLKRKADPNTRSEDGLNSPLIEAARQGDTHILLLLIHGGATLQMERDGDVSTIMNAVRHGHGAAVTLLLKHGASHSMVDGEGNAPLHVATSAGHFDAAAALLNGNADINQRNFETLTPLMLAAKERNLPAMKFLLEQGADETLRSDLNETAHDIAYAFAGDDHAFLRGYEMLIATRRAERTREFLPMLKDGTGETMVPPARAAFRRRPSP